MRSLLFPTYVASNLIIALAVPMFFAVLLPVTTIITLVLACSAEAVIKSMKQPVFIITAIIAALMIATTPFSLKPDHSLTEALQFSVSILCIAILWSVKPHISHQLSSRHQKWAMVIFVFLITILAILNFAVMQQWLDWKPFTLNRVAVIYALFIWPFFLLLPDIKNTIYKYVLVLFLFVAISLGTSETALLMLIAGILTFGFYKIIKLPTKYSAALFLLAIIILSITPTIMAYLNGANLLAGYEGLLSSKLHQLEIWSKSYKEVIAHLPFGAGINVSQYFSEYPDMVSYGFDIHHPHNFALELMLDFGLFGIFLIGLILFGLTKIFLMTPDQMRPYVAATFSSLIVLYSLAFSIWQEWRTGFVAFAFVLIARNIKRTSQSS